MFRLFRVLSFLYGLSTLNPEDSSYIFYFVSCAQNGLAWIVEDQEGKILGMKISQYLKNIVFHTIFSNIIYWIIYPLFYWFVMLPLSA